jgi:S1-C subfamily serine protease
MGGSTKAFGSSFLWVDPRTDESYLISCEHVISGAYHNAATFQKRDGTLSSYEDIELIFDDPGYDLSMFAIGKTAREGLEISLEEVEEGITEVWSAGFPSLGLSPVFQVGRGYITNASVTIIPHGEFIQHDANISEASSGGPLVIRTSAREGTFEKKRFAVVGVNAAYAGRRQNTFFAIPNRLLVNFIERGLKKASPDALWDDENNDSLDIANTIMLDKTINGALNKLGDIDCYRIDIPKNISTRLGVTVNGNEFLDVQLFDANGGKLNVLKDAYGVIYADLPAGAGTVFVEVKQESPFFNVYALRGELQ